MPPVEEAGIGAAAGPSVRDAGREVERALLLQRQVAPGVVEPVGAQRDRCHVEGTGVADTAPNWTRGEAVTGWHPALRMPAIAAPLRRRVRRSGGRGAGVLSGLRPGPRQTCRRRVVPRPT
jgi:hypothetical protein